MFWNFLAPSSDVLLQIDVDSRSLPSHKVLGLRRPPAPHVRRNSPQIPYFGGFPNTTFVFQVKKIEFASKLACLLILCIFFLNSRLGFNPSPYSYLLLLYVVVLLWRQDFVNWKYFLRLPIFIKPNCCALKIIFVTSIPLFLNPNCCALKTLSSSSSLACQPFHCAAPSIPQATQTTNQRCWLGGKTNLKFRFSA